MTRAIVMPKLGLTMTEGVVAEWSVEPGSIFKAGEVIFLVETEKVVNEVLAEQDGIIDALLAPAGATVAVGETVATFRTDTGTTTAAARVEKALAPPSTSPTPSTMVELKAVQAAPERVIATPLARRLAREHGLSLASLRGQGSSGRIKMADVERALAAQPPEMIATTAPVAAVIGGMAQPGQQIWLEIHAVKLLALQAACEAAIDGGSLPVAAFVIAAAARALTDSPPGGAAEARCVTVALTCRRPGGAVRRIIENAGAGRISDLAVRMTQEKDESSEAGDAAAQISVIDLSSRSVRLLSWAPAPGEAFSISIGQSPNTLHAGDGVQTLALCINCAPDITFDDALAFSDRFAALLEEPMLLLVR